MKTFWRFFAYLKPYMRSLVLANICMILFVLFNLISITLIMPFIDLLFKPSPVSQPKEIAFTVFSMKEYLNYKLWMLSKNYDKISLLTILSVLMIVVFMLKNLFSYLQTYFMSTVEQGMIRDIRLSIYSHFHKLPLSYFTEEKKGTLISRIINDVQIIKDSIVAVINSAFRDPTLILSFTIVLLIFNWKLTVLVFLLTPISGAILTKIGNSLKRKSIRAQESVAEVTSILDETLGAIRIVKAFNMEQYEIDRFDKAERKYFGLLTTLARRRALASPITEAVAILTVTVILYIIGRDILAGTSDMSPGEFIVYLGIFLQMLPSLKLVGQVFNSMKEGTAASERVFSILDIKPSILDKDNPVEMKSFNNKIEFKGVSFKYEKSELILNNINCEINKGQVVAIVGPSGAGKSTFIDLIPRFYDVTEGQVLIDGTDVRDMRISSLRDMMGIVTQETILFNDTVYNNIAYGSTNKAKKEIIEAAKASNAHVFIQNLPQGYDTIIGDRGVKLSGGERQRISIARALLKNPPILILDEATSSLDTESEVLVQHAIERLMQGRTSIVIAHRLSTIRNADNILVLGDGIIVEQGKNDELLKHEGLYHKLYNMQFRLK
jgi:ATP-binding cassette, subfamily B, bacterial MsbA